MVAITMLDLWSFYIIKYCVSWIVIPQSLKKGCMLANGRYKLAFEDSKKETVEMEKSRKRKLKLEKIANVKKAN